jgi:YecM protein
VFQSRNATFASPRKAPLAWASVRECRLTQERLARRDVVHILRLVRSHLERHARANFESVWNGRPISKIVLAEPLEVLDGTPVSNIELIPPIHQRVYRMGLEHLGFVVGEEFDDFSRAHRAVLTGQQFQSSEVDPVYVLFEDFTHVKFYRSSFFDVVEDAVGGFEGFVHVDDWVPQRFVTATGPNPLPR